MKKILLALSAIVLLSGCALLFKGTNQTVPFNSDPAGAEVYIDGAKMGTTPLQIQLKVDRSYTVTFKKDGKERTVILRNEIGPIWVVLDLFGLAPLIIDAATGAWYELQPGQVNVDLK